jgi:uncharacterized damage-inducible protein DinB
MPVSPMRDAFAHHIWATGRVIEACGALEPAQLDTEVPGTYGPILTTLRHLVGSDSWYLFDITGDRARRIDPDRMDLAELRTAIDSDGAAWATLIAQDPDADTILKEIDEEDGFERDATVGLRLAQALHHGTDHRSQICTALTTLGVEPPAIDVWNFGVASGRSVEVMPSS